MKKKLLPLIGIGLCFLVFVSNMLTTRAHEQAAGTPAPALPEITSATQPMTLDEIYLRFRKNYESSMPGHFLLDMDKEASTLTLDMWVDGFNAAVPNSALHSREYLEKWNANLEETRELCAQMQQLTVDHGHPELSVVVRTVNCDDPGQIFAVFERGVLTYDVVADTPAGESVPDPTSRVQPTVTTSTVNTYVVNISSGVFHLPGCSAASQIADYNRGTVTGDRADLIAQGYRPCGSCNP